MDEIAEAEAAVEIEEIGALATVTKDRRGGSDIWRMVGTNVASKVVVLGLSGAIAVVTTRLIIGHFGVGAYAQYGLLASLSSLVPFADLGMSAAVINVVASSKSPSDDLAVRRTLVSAIRILLCSSLVICTIGVLISVFGLWPTLLGKGLMSHGGSLAALFCVIVFGLTLPLGVGQRILTGLGKNHIQIRTQIIPGPFMLAAVLVLVFFGIKNGNYLAVFSYLGGSLMAVAAVIVAARMVRPQLSSVMREVFKVRTAKGESVMGVAWPMLAQMLALPIAMQTDRLLLSHLSGSNQLAQYNLASQLFGLIIQTISTAGIALWPVFARARAGSEVRSPYSLTGGFLGGGLVLAGILAAIMPIAVHIVAGGRLSLTPALVIGFVVFVGAQSAKYPLGMYMTDLKGLRFQVLPIVIMVPLNLGLSWYLIKPLGAAGPIWGSAITVILCQALPNLWYVRRDLARRRLLSIIPPVNTSEILVEAKPGKHSAD